jgi:hypothetical protein
LNRLWQQAYHIDYLAADIIRYFWRSRRRLVLDTAGESYLGDIPSSDIDASVYESHVSHVSHASSLHSTSRSVAAVPADIRHDFEFGFQQQISSSHAAYSIAAAAGRMLWQQAYHVDYLASSIISHFWRSRKRRNLVDTAPILLPRHRNNECDDMRQVQACSHAMLVEDAVLLLHGCMARAVWRQGFIIDCTAASIISRYWKNLKRKQAIMEQDVQFILSNLVDSICCAPFDFLASKNALKENISAAADVDEAVCVSSQCDQEIALFSTRTPSLASKKAFGALLRASRTNKLRELLCILSEDKCSHTAVITPDSRQLANREALVFSSLQSAVGASELLPHEIVLELLMQSGVFAPSAAIMMTERLKATHCIFLAIFPQIVSFPSLANNIFLQLEDANHDSSVRFVRREMLCFRRLPLKFNCKQACTSVFFAVL